jgi:hypothetical protein
VRSVRVNRDDASGDTEIGSSEKLQLVDQLAILSAGYTAEKVFEYPAHALAAINDRARVLQLILSHGFSEKNMAQLFEIRASNARARS